MNIKTIILSSLILLPSLAFALAPITPKEHQDLLKGEMVQVVTWKDGFVWPEVSVRVLLNHNPQNNMEVFMDFESHKKYIPDVLESKVVKRISPENMHVYLAMEMPWPVNKSVQVTNNVLTKDKDGSYTLQWNLVEAKYVKATDGHITFKPYNGKTLMEYVTFIVPNSSLAGMFKDRVATDVAKTVKKITQHLNKALNKKEAGTSVVHGPDSQQNKL